MGHPLQQTPRWLSATLVSLAISTQTWAATPPSSASEHVEARLQIDTGKAGAGADVLHRRIEERANIVLRHAKILPGDADDVAMVIAVRELVGEEPGYAVTFELRASDGSPLDEPLEVVCALCTETELVARVEAEIEGLSAALHELEPEPAALPPTTIEPREAPPVEPPRSSTGMLAGGVTLVVVGSGLLGAGAGLSVMQPKVDEQNPLDLITTRPVGYALLASGVVVAVTGAVLTAVAIKRRRAHRLAVLPYAGRRRAGLTIGWRF